jgi:hypothetical protein
VESVLSDDDIRYVHEQFVPLAELCDDAEAARARTAAGALPAPPYPGLDYVPEDYFELAAAAGSLPDDAREAFMAGTYFVCLRRATPENIARKSVLVDSLRAVLARPQPDDDEWRGRLRAEVGELDELERPFSPDYDRERFGRPPTRDELIAAPRRRYPDVF